MKFEIGWIAVVLSIVFFYVRMIQLRGRRREEARQEELTRLKAQAKRKANQPPVPAKANRPTYQIGSWFLLAGGAALMLLGMSLRTPSTLLADYSTYWWVATSLGVVVFTFGLK
jgi:hypothetical protein